MTSDADDTRFRPFGPLATALGKLGALVVLALVLVFGPLAMMALNDALTWPAWRIPAGPLIGGAFMATALAIWLYCTHVFERAGRGTPFITEPPKRLVTVGMYRYSRNPIYVGHLAILYGWFFIFGHPTLLLYAVAWTAILQAVILAWEEPHLRARFGEDFDRYARTVPRWFLIRPRRPEH